MSENNYIAVLKQGLSKKIDILDTLIALNVQQKEMLHNPELDPDELEDNFKQKSELVDELNMLDDGFEQVYERVRELLGKNREQYAEDIRMMQKSIAMIMDRSTKIQSQEQRNKLLMEQKFSTVRKQVKEVKQSRKAVSSYYQNMMKINYVDPQFMDDKK